MRFSSPPKREEATNQLDGASQRSPSPRSPSTNNSDGTSLRLRGGMPSKGAVKQRQTYKRNEMRDAGKAVQKAIMRIEKAIQKAAARLEYEAMFATVPAATCPVPAAMWSVLLCSMPHTCTCHVCMQRACMHSAALDTPPPYPNCHMPHTHTLHWFPL